VLRKKTIRIVELPFDRDDVDVILRGLFDLNARVQRGVEDVAAIPRLLEEDDDGGEEETA
jgi:hypothetical protein